MPSPASKLPCGRVTCGLPGPAPDRRGVLREMLTRLEEYVSSKQLNRREARAQILETIVLEASHFRPADLLARLQARYPKVGRATVYRNLPVLVDSGILQEGPRDRSGQILYELSGDEHHDHLVCLDCHHIFEFHDDAIERKQARVSKDLGFTVRDHRHVVYASCDLLKKKAARRVGA
jgi:Fur family transcriptional regulator, ferric uptake regulator